MNTWRQKQTYAWDPSQLLGWPAGLMLTAGDDSFHQRCHNCPRHNQLLLEVCLIFNTGCASCQDASPRAPCSTASQSGQGYACVPRCLDCCFEQEFTSSILALETFSGGSLIALGTYEFVLLRLKNSQRPQTMCHSSPFLFSEHSGPCLPYLNVQ